MCAKKVAAAEPKAPVAKTTPAPSRLSRVAVLARGVGQYRGWLLAALILCAAGGAWRVIWQRVKPHVLAEDDYQLSAADIELTPALPKWIRTDIKTEVIRDASLAKSMSILDPELTVRIKQAFALHPWIAEVHRVTKRHPASVKIEVTYRQPVAMVEVARGLLPIDVEGVLLPSDDFSPKQAEQYPRLGGVESIPRGPIGSRWGDARVTGGALIAAALQEEWRRLGLFRIVASPGRAAVKSIEDCSFELFTHAGTRIVWGRVTDASAKASPTTGQKVATLLKIYADKGSLDVASSESDSGGTIDLAGSTATIKPLPNRDAADQGAGTSPQ